MNIPVFHDDQHGTAIIVGAAIYNGLRLVGKEIGDVKLVTSGAGAAALACLDLLVSLGIRQENIWVTDIAGVVHEGRTELMDRWKARYAQPTDKRSEEHTSELQSLMRISYAVFCLKKKKTTHLHKSVT